MNGKKSDTRLHTGLVCLSYGVRCSPVRATEHVCGQVVSCPLLLSLEVAWPKVRVRVIQFMCTNVYVRLAKPRMSRHSPVSASLLKV